MYDQVSTNSKNKDYDLYRENSEIEGQVYIAKVDLAKGGEEKNGKRIPPHKDMEAL